jgi:hypothetical protein
MWYIILCDAQPIQQVGPAGEPERAGKVATSQAAQPKNWIPERQQIEASGRAAKGRNEMEISAPFNFQHHVHVRVRLLKICHCLSTNVKLRTPLSIGNMERKWHGRH